MAQPDAERRYNMRANWSESFFSEEFPAIKQQINGQQLVYLDNAATSLKPRRVVDRVTQFYLFESANVHRGAHFLSDKATTQFEEVRNQVSQFIGAKSSREVIFTRGTTESLNLLARSIGSSLNPGDEILLSKMEHHSNIVPWQMIATERNLKVQFIDLNPDGTLNHESFNRLLSDKTKVLSLVHCSNALGTINPLHDFFGAAKGVGAITIGDMAQSISLLPIHVQSMPIDFLAFSGHKMFAPTGVGVLWGREELLNQLPPYQGGGSMIEKVSLEKTTFLSSPQRFEAGTPHIAGVIGLGEAIRFIEDLSLDLINQHEVKLAETARNELKQLPGVRLIGEANERANIVSFVIEGIHSSDIGQILDQEGIALRTGHHCTQPLMTYFQVPGTIRASFSIYNTFSDIERLISSTRKAMDFFT